MFSIRNMVAEAVRENLDFEEHMRTFISMKVEEIMGTIDTEEFIYDLIESEISESRIENEVENALMELVGDMID